MGRYWRPVSEQADARLIGDGVNSPFDRGRVRTGDYPSDLDALPTAFTRGIAERPRLRCGIRCGRSSGQIGRFTGHRGLTQRSDCNVPEGRDVSQADVDEGHVRREFRKRELQQTRLADAQPEPTGKHRRAETAIELGARNVT